MRARIWVATFPVALVLLAASAPRAAIGAVGSPAVTCTSSWSAADEPPNPAGLSGPDILNGVTVLSSTNAWAVGSYFNGMADPTLIVHWNGPAWANVASPAPGGRANNTVLNGITATSTSNVWAVGYYFKQGGAYRTLTVHWTGTAWSSVPSANAGPPGEDNMLNAVAATSASNIWAVGDISDGTADRTLIERRTGSSWAVVASPNPVTGPADIDVLTGVAATSDSNAWAVGTYSHGTVGRTLIVRWDGASWKIVPSPSPGGRAGESVLTGVAASGACSA